MIKYTTSDIIKRAQELADLQNSDFITWAENMHLLDESYKKLYQEAINANDKYYIQTITVNDLTVAERRDKEVRYYLPEDFYQLQSLIISGSSEVVLKKALTESNSSMRYDIINNTLILYGGVESKNLIINYYPVPKTLTIKAPEVQVSIPGIELDCLKTKYLIYREEEANFTFFILNIETGEEKELFSVANSIEIKCGLLGNRAAAFRIGYALKVFDLVKNQLSSFSDLYFIGKKDSALFLCMRDQEGGKGYFIFKETNLSIHYDFIETPVDITDLIHDSAFTFDESGNIYYVQGDKLCYINRDGITETEIRVTDPFHFQLINGDIWSVNSSIQKNGEDFIKDDDFAHFIGVNKVDYDTGYGVSVTSLDDDKVHIMSCFRDTILNFPNNFYFSYLSYMLAIAYKVKQNADATALMTRAGEEAAQFYDSLTRDTAENFRIQNVYSSGGIY